MRLIEKIEVNYLRSLYGATLDRVGDMNVVFGRNDSGKSNLLRALNLFFNDEIESGQPLTFSVDMSDQRRQEARDAKGRQFIWIKISFLVPENYRNSLGQSISIKRQWNRDGDMNQTVFTEEGREISQARLTRFLNDIDFVYVPAVKDLNVYADLIERMYGAAADIEEMRVATNHFVEAIGAQTVSLSDQLELLFGAPAKLAAPTEMSRLFRNLDFAHGDAGHSLLRQKGDGVKARHLPELLRFINEREARKKLFIWGFEEPENSLDLGAAEREAQRFAAFANRQDTQVFITSHSPAFYLTAPESPARVRRYFVTKQEFSGDGMIPANAVSLIDRVEDAELKMEQAGLLQLPFVIKQMSEQREALRAKEAEAEALRSELDRLNKPTLFVEGLHDVRLFSAAFARLGLLEEFDVKALGGTPQNADALLSAVLEQGGLRTSAPTLFLFDDDKAGRSAARKLSRTALTGGPVTYRDATKVWVLPHTDDFKRFLRRREITSDQAFYTAEFVFPAEESAALCLELSEESEAEDVVAWRSTINGDYWPSLGQLRCSQLANSPAGSIDWFFARGVPPSLKAAFSRSADERGMSTEHLDGICAQIQEALLAAP